METNSTTVGSVIRRVFPNGTRADSTDSVEFAPNWPPDAFAVCALLLEVSGAYHSVVSGSLPTGMKKDHALLVSQDDQAEWKQLADHWASHPSIAVRPEAIGTPIDVHPRIAEFWAELLAHRDASIVHGGGKVEGWWRPALALFVIADECCAAVGYMAHAEAHSSSARTDASKVALSQPTWITEIAAIAFLEINIPELNGSMASTVDGRSDDNATIAMMADPDVVCVQPKARTPAVGCTLRTLSHNLAKLPPRGTVTSHWQSLPEPAGATPFDELNLLLVPFPYRIEPKWFAPRIATDEGGAKLDWGWFGLKQKWLRRVPIDRTPDRTGESMTPTFNTTVLVELLLSECRRSNTPIHGIVFPEYALTPNAHQEIVKTILDNPDRYGSIELFIAGASNHEPEVSGENGNRVYVTQFVKMESGARLAYTDNRDKHHRWMLNRSQFDTYALSRHDGFARDMMFWEEIALPRRRIHFNVFRRSSIFATMICEDMARSDPCHELLRSLGPNLIFALLMDGPQLPTRWSARYATSLADDPGSSVLTFTSRALVERSNGTSAYPPSHVVALWKDDSGKTQEIRCSLDQHAVVVSLHADEATERTLDGRVNRDTCSWRFHYQHPISLRDSEDQNERYLRRIFGIH